MNVIHSCKIILYFINLNMLKFGIIKVLANTNYWVLYYLIIISLGMINKASKYRKNILCKLKNALHILMQQN